MEELYVSPQLNVICFAPVERLADLGDLTKSLPDVSGGQKPGASVEDEDFGMDL